MKRYAIACGLVAALALLCACRATPVPTSLPETLLPAATATSTATPVPTATPTLPPTSTSTLEPTHTVAPTSTDVPPRPTPTSTPIPTPTRTPSPTFSPTPTRTPVPTPTPTSTLVPDLNTLQIVGHIGGRGSVIRARGNYVYAGFGSEMAILDISVPERPKRIGYVVLPGLVNDIALNGNYAYVVGGGLYIIDISDPTAPNRVSHANISSGGHAIALSGSLSKSSESYAYIAQAPYYRDRRDVSSSYIVDVSNPAQPIQVGTIPYGAYDIAATVRYLGGREQVYVYVGDDKGLRVIDVNDPYHPVPLIHYPTQDYVKNVQIDGTRAYVVVNKQDLHILDISNPLEMVEMGYAGFEGYCSEMTRVASQITTLRDMVYLVGCAPGVRILDVSDPTRPSRVSLYEIPRAVSKGIAAVTVPSSAADPSSKTYVYAGNGDYLDGRIDYLYGGLRVLDVSDPGQPAQIGDYRAPADISDVALHRHQDTNKSYAYIAAMQEGMYVLDVSDPTRPETVNILGVDLFATRVRIGGSAAYLLDQENFFVWQCEGSLKSFDLTDPVHPVQSGIYDPPYGIDYFTLTEDRIYLDGKGCPSCREQCSVLLIVDRQDPANLVEIGMYDMGMYGGWLVGTDGRFAYLSIQTGPNPTAGRPPRTPLVLDVSDPSYPVEVDIKDHRTAYEAARLPPSIGHYGFHVGELVDEWDDIKVLDLSDPTEVRRVDVFTLPSWVTEVYVPPPSLSLSGQDLVYVADARGGLYILRFTPPAE